MAILINPPGINRGGAVGTPFVVTYQRDEFLDMLEDDLETVFMGPDGQDFAENQSTVKYLHRGDKVAVNYSVIFDDPHTSQNVGAMAEFNSLKPQFMIQQTKLKKPISKNDMVTVRGVKYKVDDYQADGVGVMTLFLRRF